MAAAISSLDCSSQYGIIIPNKRHIARARNLLIDFIFSEAGANYLGFEDFPSFAQDVLHQSNNVNRDFFTMEMGGRICMVIQNATGAGELDDFVREVFFADGFFEQDQFLQTVINDILVLARARSFTLLKSSKRAQAVQKIAKCILENQTFLKILQQRRKASPNFYISFWVDAPQKPSFNTLLREFITKEFDEKSVVREVYDHSKTNKMKLIQDVFKLVFH